MFCNKPDWPREQIRRNAQDLYDQYLYDFILKPVVEANGYNINRADTINESGQINIQIIGKIYDSDLIIADLTYQNPNVFYELAIRHATRKPSIQLIRKDQEIPFDNKQTRTIYYDLDVRGAEEAKILLNKLIKSKPDGEVENPISNALTFRALKESVVPENQIMAEIIDKIQTLDNKLGMIHNQMIRLANQNLPKAYSIGEFLSHRQSLETAISDPSIYYIRDDNKEKKTKK